MIYFILNSAAGAMKIGKSHDPEERLKTLQISSPDVLKLLGSIPGGKTEETYVHRQCKLWRIRGEWFKVDPGLVELVNSWIARPLFVGETNPMLGTPRLWKTELLAYAKLLRLLAVHGVAAFSRRGPLGDSIDETVKTIAREIYRTTGDAGMDRVFDAIETVAQRQFGELGCVCVSHALDHRFDGIGEWRA